MTSRKQIFGGLFGRAPVGETPPTDENAAPGAKDNKLLRDEDGAPVRAGPPEELENRGLLRRLRDGLARSSAKLSAGIGSIVNSRPLDAEALEELEDLLIAADLGAPAARRITEELARERFAKGVSETEARSALAGIVAGLLAPYQAPLRLAIDAKPHVILVVGVNGSGKTTTIGKLAAKFRDEGRSVMLVAGDTFRAAAIEQLKAWGLRAGVPVMAGDIGADAAGLAFEGLKRAQTGNVDVLIVDTAGRLQNRRELMDELAKIVRVLGKLDPDAPHDTLLVLDATVGQNAISQTDAFRDIAGVTGLVMTKLDGTARGGILVALAERHKLPIHWIGVGEELDDLQPFNADHFARTLAGFPVADEEGAQR